MGENGGGSSMDQRGSISHVESFYACSERRQRGVSRKKEKTGRMVYEEGDN